MLNIWRANIKQKVNQRSMNIHKASPYTIQNVAETDDENVKCVQMMAHHNYFFVCACEFVVVVSVLVNICHHGSSLHCLPSFK